MPVPPADRRLRALVASHVPVTDSRPSKQISWLESAGYRVDVLSREAAHPAASGHHYEIGFPPLPARLAAYGMLPNRARYRFMIDRQIPSALIPDPSAKYDVVIVHDLELLPWFVAHAAELSDGPILLDLHEFFGSQGIGFTYRVLFARYHRWLLGMVADPAFTVRTTVADGIADLYVSTLGITRPTVVKNTPPFASLRPSDRHDDRILLVHHGRADLGRGLELMLDAMLQLDARFTLVLMLVGDERELAFFRRHPAVAAGRVEFRDPVAVDQVPAALNECDLEIIFFPPKTENLRFVLPNKLFEAIQARLGVVIGESVEMVRVVQGAGNGIVVPEWSSESLAATIASLNADDVRRFKEASDAVARQYSAEHERSVFLELIGATA
jgi:glycosyltransferase involved in cell wall biosynthesis